jgi:hypothetical protein
LNLKINLGTGEGTSVLKLLEVFQRVNKIKVRYSFAERREGDLGDHFNNSKANELSANITPKSPSLLSAKLYLTFILFTLWKTSKSFKTLVPSPVPKLIFKFND